MNHIFPRSTTLFLVVSVVAVNWYDIFVAHEYTALYYVLWLGVGGVFFVTRYDVISHWLRRWRTHAFLKFIILGYVAVLLEELIAGLVHAANEGFTVTGFVLRTAQFWAFNIFAFTGFILGWYVALRRFAYRATDIFLISGIWGLFSEHIIALLFASPLAAIFLALPTMSTYNLIIAPAIASGEWKGAEIGVVKRYVYAFGAFLVFSVIPVVLVGILRTKFPGAFPPCAYIPCAAW